LKHLEFFYAALSNITRHKLRSIVVVLCLIAILFPFISAIAVSEGVKSQSKISVNEGADIYVTMDMYGRNGVIPIEMADEIKKMEGVERVVPRVVSRIYIGGKLMTLLGMPSAEPQSSNNFIKGTFPKAGEVVIGSGLANEMKLDTGSSISIGIRVIGIADHKPYIMRKQYRVSGVFDSNAGIWTSNLVLMDIDDAVSTYEMDGFVTDIAVYAKSGHELPVIEGIQKMNPFFRIQTKGLVRAYFERGFNTKAGIFISLYTIAFAISIPALLISSGLGLSDRRREIGIMKATGWLTGEVMEMVFIENMILALIGASSAFLISFVWIKLFNGFFIARLFISGIENMPHFIVPAKFMPLPFAMSFFFALILTMTGSIYSTWRAAVVPPTEAMK
jgi:ABC-type lipoprotein release transport system permease subunit